MEHPSNSPRADHAGMIPDTTATQKSSYGIGRLGLLPPSHPVPEPAQKPQRPKTPPAPLPQPPAKRPGLLQPLLRGVQAIALPRPNPNRPQYSRGTFKLPRELHNRLRVRAHARNRYQYEIVTEALEEYLDRTESPDKLTSPLPVSAHCPATASIGEETATVSQKDHPAPKEHKSSILRMLGLSS